MSNLLSNGTFSVPVIPSNSYIVSTSLTTQQKTDLIWNASGTSYLVNGVTAFDVPDPSLINQTQFIIIQFVGAVSQQFTVTKLSSYKLTFYYSIRGGGYPLNNVQIYLGGSLIDTLTTIPTNWSLYTSPVLYPVVGTTTLLFQGQDSGFDRDTALANIQFSEYTQATTFNSLRSTQIFGYLTLTDYILNGRTISGILSASQINYNYSILPTFTSSNLGYTNSGTNAATSVLINSFTSSTITSLPIGLYIIQSYALFTPSSSAIYNLKLGLSTTINTLSTFNYTTNVNQASLLPVSINYQFYLSNSAITTYYIVFNTNIAGTLSGTLNYKFIRMA